MSSRLCKFDCGKELTWDNSKAKYMEQDGTEHTRERCESLKQKPVAKPTQPNGSSDISKMHEENMVANRLLVAAINRLAAAIEARSK